MDDAADILDMRAEASAVPGARRAAGGVTRLGAVFRSTDRKSVV